MPRASTFNGNFSAGELSPLLDARINTDAYQSGLKTAENVLVKPQGAVQNRAGFEFIKEVKFSAKSTRFIEFVFSTLQAYGIELGDQYMRFYRNGEAIVEAAETITGITQANPAVVTTSTNTYVDDDSVFLDAIVGMTELNGKFFTINQLSTTTFELVGVDSTGFTAYSSGGTAEKHHEIATPWLEAEIDDVQFAQSADTMFLAHPNHQPRKVTRTDHNAWTIVLYAPTANPFTGASDFPRGVTIYEQRIVWGGTDNEPQTIFGSKAGDFENMTVGTADGDGYEYVLGSTRINKIQWLHAEDFLQIGTFGGIAIARGSGLEQAITPTNISVRLNAAVAASTEEPVLVQDLTIYIQRLGQRVMAMGFDGNRNKYVTRDTTIRTQGITANSVKQLAYQEEPDKLLHMIRSDGQLISVTLDFAETINAWVRGITQGFFESVAVIPASDRDEVWCIVRREINGATVRYVERQAERKDENQRKDNFYVDAGLCYEGDAAGIAAGATMTPSAATGDAITFTASATVFTAADVGKEIVNEEEDSDGVRLLGRATITGFTSGTVVTADITQDFPDTTALAAGDWSLAVLSISNLEFLEGATVKVTVDGSTHTDEVVTSGAITLTTSASFVCIGLGYTSKMVGQRVEAGAGDGTAQSKKKKIHTVSIRVRRTAGISVGSNEGVALKPVELRKATDPLDQPVPLKTGDIRVHPTGGWNTEGRIIVEQSQPLPMTILGWAIQLVTSDG